MSKFTPTFLAFIMFSMGITLRKEDIVKALAAPQKVVIGVSLQFLIMPMLGWGLSRALNMDPCIALGLIVLTCCPGGAASNVVTQVARGNLALGVMLTTVSTILSIVMVPLLVVFYAGALVEVNAFQIMKSVSQVIITPVVCGLLLNEYLDRFNRRLQCQLQIMLPALGVLVSTACTSIAFASVSGLLKEASAPVLGANLLGVILAHAGGFLLGYRGARACQCDKRDARTVSIEVGMQSSVMALVLMQRHFPNNLQAQIPCALSAVIMNVMGALYAFLWRTYSKPLPEAEGSSATAGGTKSLTLST